MQWCAGQPDPFRETRVVVHPMLGPHDGLDVTDSIIDAIANELSRHSAGNPVLDRLEAESLLAQFLHSLTPDTKLNGAMR